MVHPEAFATAQLAVPPYETALPPKRHDELAMQQLIDDGFGQELSELAQGCALDRPTGENQDVPASKIFGVSREKGREANRTSANDFIAMQTLAGGEAAYAAVTDIQKRRPQDQLGVRSFTEAHALTRRILENPADRRLFRALNIYSDFGKTDIAVEWANTVDELRGSNDHDKIIAVLLQPAHEAARTRLLPSFDTLTQEQQDAIRRMIGCNFHLPQLNNGQALPKDLEDFYQLSSKEKRILIAQEIFDIAGAQGDTITNGTGTVTESMYRRLRGTIKVLLSDDNAHLPPAERAIGDYNQVLAFHDQRFGFGYDPAAGETPDNMQARALVRLGTMFRDLSTEQILEIPGLFQTKLGETTQAHLLDFLNATGYEASGGALKSMYSSTAAARLLRESMKSGNNFADSMTLTLQFLARLNSAVRQNIDITDTSVTNIVARDLVTIAETDWPQLRDHEIIAIKTGVGQGRFAVKRQPTVGIDRDSAAQKLATPAAAQLPSEHGLWIAAGGGGDIYTTGFLAQTVFKQEDPTLVSVWGKPENVRRARPIGDSGRIFRADTETVIENTRHMEHLVAARGLQTVIVCFDPRRDSPKTLADDFRRLADHLQVDPTHIAVVDTGGDILATPQAGQRPERDHSSMQAALGLQEYLGTAVSNLFVAVPGVDAPANMAAVAQTAGVQAYDLAPYAQAFYDRAREDGVMSADPKLYSRMIQTMWYALHPQTLAQKAYVNQPLLLPTEQALKRVKARPAFAAITEQMHYLHQYDLRRVAQVIGIS